MPLYPSKTRNIKDIDAEIIIFLCFDISEFKIKNNDIGPYSMTESFVNNANK